MPIPETKYKYRQTVVYYTADRKNCGDFLFIENHTTDVPANITVYHGILFRLKATGNAKFPIAPVFVGIETSVPEEQLKSLEEAV